MEKIKEDIIDKPISGKVPCLWKILWNRQTAKVFDKGRRPHQGARYVWKCVRYDGKEASFVLEQL